jgi:hypothetical protein
MPQRKFLDLTAYGKLNYGVVHADGGKPYLFPDRMRFRAGFERLM